MFFFFSFTLQPYQFYNHSSRTFWFSCLLYLLFPPLNIFIAKKNYKRKFYFRYLWTLFKNKRFVHNEMFLQNVLKLAIFNIKKKNTVFYFIFHFFSFSLSANLLFLKSKFVNCDEVSFFKKPVGIGQKHNNITKKFTSLLSSQLDPYFCMQDIFDNNAIENHSDWGLAKTKLFEYQRLVPKWPK